jgi:dolichol-phosphate mannosyltransferase
LSNLEVALEPCLATKHSAAQSIWIVIPAFNEAACLAELLHRVRETLQYSRLPYQTVVVDDGSSDDTSTIAAANLDSMPLVILKHEQNLGLGATIRDGIRHAISSGSANDIVVTMDGDNTHPPELIPRMIDYLREGRDVVIASRYRPGSHCAGVPGHRMLLSRGAGLLFRLSFPIAGVKDYNSGYRAYRMSALRDATAIYGDKLFDQRGFQCMVDLLLKLAPMRLIFGEVPLVLRYDLKQGESKMKVSRTVIDTLRLMLRRRFKTQSWE